MWALCKTINKQNKGKTYSEPQLEGFFNKFWPDFASRFDSLLKKHGQSTPPKPKEVREMVEQILDTVQALLSASQSKLPSVASLATLLEYSPDDPALSYLTYPGSRVYPPIVLRPSLAQLPTGLHPDSSAAAGLEVNLDELTGKVVRPAMTQGQKPESSKPEVPPNKPPAA